MSHKEELQGRANALQQEIQDLSKQFEMKKEEFLKVQGALEMLQILENEKNSKKLDEIVIKRTHPKTFRLMWLTRPTPSIRMKG